MCGRSVGWPGFHTAPRGCLWAAPVLEGAPDLAALARHSAGRTVVFGIEDRLRGCDAPVPTGAAPGPGEGGQ